MKIKTSLLLSFFLILNSAGTAQDTLVYKAADNPYLSVNDTVLVFSPRIDKKVPAVIMLHGWSGNYNQWSGLADLNRTADSLQMIIVCPDGLYDSWYVNSTEETGLQMEDFIIKVLVPSIAAEYPVDTAALFITGLSMGGHGAVSLFLKHPDIFKAAGSTSGVMDICLFPEKWGMKSRIGIISENKEVWERNSAYYLLDSYKGRDLRLIIDCGTEDFAYEVNLSFAEKCRRLKIPLKFISQPGNHSRNYWSSSISSHFHLFKEIYIKSARR